MKTKNIKKGERNKIKSNIYFSSKVFDRWIEMKMDTLLTTSQVATGGDELNSYAFVEYKQSEKRLFCEKENFLVISNIF